MVTKDDPAKDVFDKPFHMIPSIGEGSGSSSTKVKTALVFVWVCSSHGLVLLFDSHHVERKTI